MATLVNTNYFSPTQIAGCALWIDTADVSSLFKDTAGTQPVTTNGDIVRRINDKSGNSRNATTSATTNVYNTSQSNGNSAIQVPSDSGFATPSFTISSANTCTLFIVALQNSPLTGNVALFHNNTGNNATLRLQLESTLVRINVNSRTTITSTLMLTRLGFPNIYSVGFDSSAITSFFNGTSTSGGMGGTSDGLLASPTTYAFATNTGMNGFLYEVILYNTNLTVTQRQQVEGYLAWKWGLQANLPTTHPYFYNPMIPNLILPAPLANPLTTTNTTLITMNPTQIAGCALWLDAADITTMSFSGASVTQWRDKTNNIQFNTQGTASFLTVVPNSIQNTQSLYFNNTSGENVALVGSFNQSSIFSLFVVWKNLTQNNGTFRNIIGWQFVSTPSPGAFNFGYPLTQTGSNLSIWNTQSGSHQTLLPVTNNTNYIGYSQFPTPSLSINGNSPSSSALVTTPNAPTLYIGGVIAINQTVSMYLGEVIIYNTTLTTSERQQIEGYLAWKWGLQANLPTTHPYFYNPLVPNLILPSQVYSLAPSFSPARFSGLGLWLDAADSASVVTNGSVVSRWNDKSGFGRNATTAGSPTYISSSLNGLNGVRLSGTTQRWATPSFELSPTSRVSAFVVASGTRNVNSQVNLLMSGTTFLNFVMYLSYNVAVSPPYAIFIGGQGTNLSTSFTNTQDVPNIYELVYDSSTASSFVNGTSQGTFSAPVSGSALTSSQTLVSTHNNNNTVIEYEFIFFNVTLTTNQRQQIEGYLAWKWGLQTSLPANHPYFFAPPS